MTNHDTYLIAHLMRRAGFGAPHEELVRLTDMGYEATVEELLHPEDQPELEMDVMNRYMGWRDLGYLAANQGYWTYRMVNSPRQLEEKMCLFWHGIFCVGDSKCMAPHNIQLQLDQFRDHGFGSFEAILNYLATNPAMLYYLDNQLSHKEAVNENWGRELLELFSMGVGMDDHPNYTEDDVKACAQAFTGWTIGNGLPRYPYGRYYNQFLYNQSDHINEQKTFLGETGNFNGEDVIRIISKQPATARFVSRHLYNYFVADEVPVPQWSETDPRDPKAIDFIAESYHKNNHSIKAILRDVFNSDFFKNSAFLRVKSPVELVIGTLRKTGEYQTPVGGETGIFTVMEESGFMGQKLLDPPSVEGWHTGEEWISSGSLVERVNFVTSHLGDDTHPGVKEMISKLNSITDKDSDPNSFVEACIDALGLNKIGEDTRIELVNVAREARENRNGEAKAGKIPQEVIIHMFKLIGSCKEYQLC